MGLKRVACAGIWKHTLSRALCYLFFLLRSPSCILHFPQLRIIFCQNGKLTVSSNRKINWVLIWSWYWNIANLTFSKYHTDFDDTGTIIHCLKQIFVIVRNFTRSRMIAINWKQKYFSQKKNDCSVMSKFFVAFTG